MGEKLLFHGGQIIIGGLEGRGASIGFSIVSVYWGGEEAVLSVYCQYLGIWRCGAEPMYVGLSGYWGGYGRILRGFGGICGMMGGGGAYIFTKWEKERSEFAGADAEVGDEDERACDDP